MELVPKIKRDFFFEKKKQKTLMSWSGFYGIATPPGTKVFCFFFSKKKCFLPFLMPTDLLVLLQIVLIDITLAGDNAVVVGLAVAGLPKETRRRAIIAGILGATLIRVALSAVAVSLLAMVGLTLAGGVLLLWVCWKMFRELRADQGTESAQPRHKTLGQVIMQIILADLSMSLDNVLAVAGAAHGRIWILVAGLALSVVLMGVAADLMAQLLQKQRWIAWLGLAIVGYVAVDMIIAGWHDVAHHLPSIWRHG
jgi:YjbE family integral membrane protein